MQEFQQTKGYVQCKITLLDLSIRGYKKIDQAALGERINIADAIQEIFDYVCAALSNIFQNPYIHSSVVVLFLRKFAGSEVRKKQVKRFPALNVWLLTDYC